MAWRCFFLICTGVHTSISHSGERGVGRPDGVVTGVYDCVTGGVLGIAASCGAVSGVSDCEYSFSSHPQMDVSSGICFGGGRGVRAAPSAGPWFGARGQPCRSVQSVGLGTTLGATG